MKALKAKKCIKHNLIFLKYFNISLSANIDLPTLLILFLHLKFYKIYSHNFIHQLQDYSSARFISTFFKLKRMKCTLMYIGLNILDDITATF